VGNPQLAVGDLITVNDSKVMSIAKDFFVTAINWRFRGGWLLPDARADRERFSCLPYSTGYFVLGTNKLGSTRTHFKRRMFY
jgi:hypothetical protein